MLAQLGCRRWRWPSRRGCCRGTSRSSTCRIFTAEVSCPPSAPSASSTSSTHAASLLPSICRLEVAEEGSSFFADGPFRRRVHTALRGPALRCVLVCTHEHSQKAGPFSVERLKMDLPFYNRLVYNRGHRRSAGRLTALRNVTRRGLGKLRRSAVSAFAAGRHGCGRGRPGDDRSADA